MFDDGPPMTWTDSVNGEARAACVFRPAGASSTSARPLVAFLHGGGSSADAVYNGTSLRSKAVSFNLSGDPARPGFVLVVDQGRNLPDPNGNGPGARRDFYFRDVATAADNPDVRALDHLIDAEVAIGGVDPTRIYVMGWSNGAFFAEQYAFYRHVQPTAGGNRIAAAAVYAGGDPFQAPRVSQPECALRDVPPVPPFYEIHRSCDGMVACDAAHNSQFGLPPGYDVETWMQRVLGPLGGTNVTDVIIDAMAATAMSCDDTASCTKTAGDANHIHWPDGVADGSGVDWEPKMLGFLMANVNR
jgi:predicted esterase